MSDAHMWTADTRPRPSVYLTFEDGRGREIALHADEPDDRQFDRMLATFEQLAASPAMEPTDV